MGRELVPRVPSPKLIPQGDGDVGVPWDAHVCPEASRARRILSVLLKARGSADVSTFILTFVPSCCSLRELLLLFAMSGARSWVGSHPAGSVGDP